MTNFKLRKIAAIGTSIAGRKKPISSSNSDMPSFLELLIFLHGWL